MIISKLDVAPTYRGWAFFIDGSDGSPRVHLTNNWGTSAYIRKGSASSATDNSWHHVVFTYNGSSLASGLNFYVDGVLSNGATFKNNLSATILNNITPTLATYTTGASWLKGTIDEVRVYNRALSAQEVFALFNEAITPNTTPAVVSATSPVNGATGMGEKRRERKARERQEWHRKKNLNPRMQEVKR